uniref:Putative 2-oxoglutarate-dependent dioxygenase DAO-like n=1 Tax=Davidia involucrata TaxID=16924 RepID=A0A5B6ZA03_DAVIN
MGLDVELFKGWPCQFRLNKYHYTPQTIGSTGALMHTDAGFLTIVQDDEIVSGLEAVDKKSGALVPIDPMPGTLLINIGDLGKAWSNGRFYNVKHRVQCNQGTIRMSIALLVLGPKEAKVEAPPQLVDSEHLRLFVPFTFEDYRMLRLSNGLPAGEALELLRLKVIKARTLLRVERTQNLDHSLLAVLLARKYTSCSSLPCMLCYLISFQ